jgi:rRNA large subunit m3Psi methyltransferase RlmH
MGKKHTNLATTPRFNVVIVQHHRFWETVLYAFENDGLDASIKQKADAIWRLSSLTLPHAMARVLLTEQLYRAWTILQGHPYHRE